MKLSSRLKKAANGEAINYDDLGIAGELLEKAEKIVRDAINRGELTMEACIWLTEIEEVNK